MKGGHIKLVEGGEHGVCDSVGFCFALEVLYKYEGE
jgi:hypothetical protein